MKLSSRPQLLAAFIAALGLLGCVEWLDWRHTNRMQETADLVAHTHEVQANLNQLLMLLVNIETGARGFVVTGQSAFLQPFESGLKAVTEQQHRLELLVHSADEKAGLAALKPMIAERIAIAKRGVDTRRNSGFAAAQQQVATGEGMIMMDKIRAQFAQMDAEEEALLVQRSAVARNEARNDILFTVVGYGISFALLITVFTLVLRENRLRQKTEESLRQSEERMSLMIESVKDYAVIMLDPVGRVMNWNTGAERINGYHAEEIIGRHFSRFYPEEKIRDGVLEMELREAAEKGRFEDEGWHVRKDGSLFWADVAINSVRNAQGKLLGFVKITRDVTLRKEAAERIQNLNEELQRRAAQLEAANKELESFSYSVSHDLRSPLRAVDGFSQAVLEDYSSHLPPEGQHYLQTIRDGAQRMGRLIDDLLTFSRLSRTSLNKQSVNIGKLVREVLEDLNSEREGRQVEFNIGELPPCQGDPALLKQVLINLLSNALKYTRQRNPAVIEIGCKLEQNENVYFVRDNGVGFDMRYADKLFGVFQRLHRAEEFEGTGVGLAIVQRVIHRHGGRIWAEAEPDRGASFYFTLKGKNK